MSYVYDTYFTSYTHTTVLQRFPIVVRDKLRVSAVYKQLVVLYFTDLNNSLLTTLNNHFKKMEKLYHFFFEFRFEKTNKQSFKQIQILQILQIHIPFQFHLQVFRPSWVAFQFPKSLQADKAR